MTREHFEHGAEILFGAIFIGSICGLLPLLLGIRRGVHGLAIISFIACIFGGYTSGVLLAFPVALGFTFVILGLDNPVIATFSAILIGASTVGGIYLSSSGKSDVHAFRELTALDGRKISAKVVGFNGQKVTIRKEDGSIFKNEIGIFSVEDQNFIRSNFPIEEVTSDRGIGNSIDKTDSGAESK